MLSGGEIVTIVLFTIGPIAWVCYPVARALARKIERGAPGEVAPAPELRARLERIEQAVDAIAVEVERIAEGQRFTTRLLSEGRAAAAPGTGDRPAAARGP